MTDFSTLPETVEQLRACIPVGFTLSERLIDPVIIIDKICGKTIARLAGARMLQGVKKVYAAPSNRHGWIVDGFTIRPLPRDTVTLFNKILGDADSENLLYSSAISLIRQTKEAISVEAEVAFLKAGQTAAEELDDEIKVPGLTATLFPYQARGVKWMRDTIEHTGGLILADEMGLGKTLQIIALLLIERPPNSAPALIVCPTSLIANWVREFSRFAPDLSVIVHRGANRTGIFRELQTSNVVISTYETMVNDISVFSSFEWSWVICDEAQAIKSPDSNRRQAMVRIPRRRTIPMTGTPVENSLLDLWSLVDFAIPGLLGSRSEFETIYPDSFESAQALAHLTDPIILKRRVTDVAGDLPPRIDIDVPIEMDELLAEHYIEVRKATIARYPVAGPLVATLQLQLICAHPWLRGSDNTDLEDADAEVVRNKYPLMTPKMERVTSLLREALQNGRKVIIFAPFNKVGDLIKEAMADYRNIFWGAINGSTSSEDRQPIIDAFSAHTGPACLILNPKAAGAGLNITAATVVIHYTPVWNPALQSQASARAHRRGQTQPVTIYRLFYKDTVEQIMVERALWKSELANESVPVSSRDSSDFKHALEISPRTI